MKAKSKVLLGLLVALAMMVMAVPAFAQTEQTGLIESITPATQEVYASNKVTFTVKVNPDGTEPVTFTAVTDAVTAPDGYTTDGESFTINTSALVQDKDNPTLYKAEIPTSSVNVAKKGAESADTTHTITVKAKQGNTEAQKSVVVTLHPEVKATLQSTKVGNAFVETVKKGEEAVANVTCDDAVAFQWQSSSATTEEAVADSTKWTDIEGKTAAAVGTVDDLNGKYIRCLVIKNKGEDNEAKFVAKATLQEATDATTDDDGNPIAAKPEVIAYCVKINVTDDSGIVITTQPTAPTVDIFKGDDLTSVPEAKLTVDATVTPAVEHTPLYEWYKDGKVVQAKGKGYAEDNKQLVPDTTKAGESEYFCRVYASNKEDAQYVDSNKVKVTVKDVPTITVENAKAETPLTWVGKNDAGDDTDGPDGEGTIVVTDLTQPLTLTANIENPENLNVTSKQWTKVDGGAPLGASDSITIKPTGDGDNKKIATGDYTFTVGFEGLTKSGTYTVHVRESKGTLKGANGGIYTSTNGTSTNPALSPEYTIQLPAGYDFVNKATYQTDEAVLESLGTGDKITGPADVKFQIKTPATDADATTGSKMTFVVNSFANQDAPYIKDMEATFKIKPYNNAAQETVALNVTDAGYKITLPAKRAKVQMTAPDKNKEIYYDGTAKTATVEPAEGVEGLGEISKIRYVELNSGRSLDTPLTDAELKTATETAPTDANGDSKAYFVICNIAKGDQYEKADNVLVDSFVIKPVTPTAVNAGTVKASNYFEMDPESVVYDGTNKGTHVTFKDGFEKTGKITDTKYYPLKADGTAEANPVIPVKIGKYQVKVTTAADTAAQNPAENVTAANGSDADHYYEVGIFEITKTVPTADLYKINPAEVTYDGTPREAVVEKDSTAGNVIGKHYFKDGSDKELEGAPTEVGVYTVKIDTEANDYYAATDKDKPLAIGTLTIKEDKPEPAVKPDIYMIGHVEGYGWGTKGDGRAVKLESGKTVQVGTTGESKRVEAVTILVPADYKVEGFAHVQDKGDTNVKDKEDTSYIKNMSDIPEGYKAYRFGTTGQSKRIEALNIAIKDADGKYVEGFEYATHIQTHGWLGSVRNGSFSGTRGLSLRLEAIRFYYDDVIRKPSEIK